MKSVTDELRERNPEMVVPAEGMADLERVEEMEAKLDDALAKEETSAQPDPEKLGLAKLRVAFATRDLMHAPKPTGVMFKGARTGSAQEIMDDGSIRNPYKRNREMSGRQRRKMRKQANRTMKARGMNARVEDILKGRRPKEVTPAAKPEPQTMIGMNTADVFGE